ncbi:hypothetical protein T08_4881 [Trichinella sp. T8]|nr:hypothetical protein T08_4881 [Trichinella sp. T8]
MSCSIPQNRRTPPDTSSYLDCVGRRHDGAGTKFFLADLMFHPLFLPIHGQVLLVFLRIPVQLPSQRSQTSHGDLVVVGRCTAPALHKSPTTYLVPSNVTDSLNFLLTSSSGLVSASCTTPIESIFQNLLNSKLSSSVAPAELLSVTVETMVVSCLPAELRAFGPQRIHPKMVSMAIGSSSPAILSPLPSTR